MSTPQDSRKILEDLQFKKAQLQKGLPIITTNIQPLQTPYETQGNISSAARATYATAVSSSNGFFITTDSSFGNSILPVLPRFE